jgi:copper homeostasis protein CutC
VKLGGTNIIIVAGAGINSGNAQRLCSFTGVEEIHFSAKKLKPVSGKKSIQGLEDEYFVTDETEVKKIIDGFKKYI